MKIKLFGLMFIVLLLTMSACSPTAAPIVEEPQVVEEESLPADPTVEPTEAPTATLVPTEEPVDDTPVLTLVGMDGEISLTLQDLMAMEVLEGQAGIKSSTGKITPPATYKGVSLNSLIEKMGEIDPTMGVNVVAEDGYGLAFSYDQITNGTFIAYDPATGDELRNPVPLTAILAYERDGELLDSREDGVLRVMIISEKNNQVTDGHWSIKWVSRLELNSLVQDWNVVVNGAISESLDRSTVESCVNCHEATWTDDVGQVWKGTPLWRFMGYGDDAIKHEGLCYVNELALDGYDVELLASDGYSAVVSSIDAHRNEAFVLATTVDGNPLPEKYFPMRLVGEGLEKSSMVGALSEVNLSIAPLTEDEIATAQQGVSETPTEAASPVDDSGELVTVAVEEGELTLTGLVSQEVGFTSEALLAWQKIIETIEHPKKGPTEYTGVYLNDLLDTIGILPDGKTLVMVADDGYTAQVALEDLRACVNCMLTIEEDGGFTTVLPGFETSTWVKGLVSLEIK